MYQSKTITRAIALASVGVGALCVSTNAQAQAIPAVDVCTGISLDPSAVTSIVGATVGPVESLESTVNAITSLGLLAPLLGLPDLNSDISTVLQDIADGEQISLTVLDSDGNVITDSDACYVTSDGYTLNQEGGISIGGNTITGLGANGQEASAAELDAIAFGNNAETTAGATNAIAIGSGAMVTAADSIALGGGSSATAENSVAIGTGSVASRGAEDGAAGEVSVGAVGSERKITNVAAGTEATDAANVGQVGAVQADVDALADSAVQYDDGTYASVTLQGASGTVVTNVADGAVNDTSTDAVNGSQLFATNETIADVDARVTVNETDIAALQDDAVMYDDASHDTITLDGVDGTTITNVADGTLDATSTDAVNGSQLFATNQNVQANTDAIDALDTRVTNVEGDIVDLGDRVTVTENNLAQLQDGAVFYDDASHDTITLDGVDGTTITNVADGALDATSTDAVNGSQLFATNQNVEANTDAIDDLDDRVTVNEGDILALDDRVTVNEGDISDLGDRVTVNEGDIVDIDNRVTVNEGDIADLQVQVANVPVGYVSDMDGMTPSAVPTQTAAFMGAAAGPVTVTNVAAATLNATSTDAVNGSQLYATNQQVAANTDAIAQNTADITNIQNNVAGSVVVAV
ncbi:hypothetical protein [Croceicoccus naphthovorans]|uniref:Uncharacterized protein n=1 Tax=Croceicoccus naphthovorans TaxID=1348774 RepID=A0A0G3XGP8_9SPHN|nr:hypothetical protein [Croceicoccus naphthovorans]AKM10705.1 hypothetical protein AB433_13165 [Croceicoccus naphthovorans]MBB3991845.1 autotransporter adhesin [Croceicoccus naphthovorans]